MDIAETAVNFKYYIFIYHFSVPVMQISRTRYYQVQSNGSRGLNTLCYDIYGRGREITTTVTGNQKPRLFCVSITGISGTMGVK